MERFNPKKLNEAEVREQYRVEILNRFAALENLDSEVDINTEKETISENIKISAKQNIGYYELKQHKTRFDGRCSEL
jgi:pyocin large subunit-like protein